MSGRKPVDLGHFTDTRLRSWEPGPQGGISSPPFLGRDNVFGPASNGRHTAST